MGAILSWLTSLSASCRKELVQKARLSEERFRCLHSICTLAQTLTRLLLVTRNNEHTVSNRPFARCRHFTTTTRILLGFLFIFKVGSLSEV